MRAFILAALVAVAAAACNSPALKFAPPPPSEQAWINVCGIDYNLCPTQPVTCCPGGYACCGAPPMLPCGAGQCENVGGDSTPIDAARARFVPQRGLP